jgi:SAM-dependent methyltransferase
LFDERGCEYQGIDIYEAKSKFDVQDPGIVFYDGANIPFPDASFDSMICVEVLEHVPHFQTLVDEMHRVMKPGAKGCVTVPWTMRYHYVPFDYFRYTPSTLRTMFSGFRKATIVPRGTDVTVAGYKVVILWLRQFFPTKPWHWCLVPVGLALTPLAMVALAVAHASMLLKVGNPDDPLGYTVFVTR